MDFMNSDKLDEVMDNMFLGNVFQAENRVLLDKFHVTHILTVARLLGLKYEVC